MLSNPTRYLLVGVALVLLPGGPVIAASAPMPQPSVLSNPTDNPYLQIGMDAIASGLRTFTVSVEISNDTNLAQRINHVHFGMSLSGWDFITHEVITRQGSSSILLLTYGSRRP